MKEVKSNSSCLIKMKPRTDYHPNWKPLPAKKIEKIQKFFFKKYGIKLAPCVGKVPDYNYAHLTPESDLVSVKSHHNGIGIILGQNYHLCMFDLDNKFKEVLEKFPFLRKLPAVWHYEKDGKSVKKAKICLPKLHFLHFTNKNKIKLQKFYKCPELDVGEFLVDSFAVIPPTYHPKSGQQYQWKHFSTFLTLMQSGTAPVYEKYKQEIEEFFTWFLDRPRYKIAETEKKEKKQKKREGGIENTYIAGWVRRQKQYHDPIPYIGKTDEEVFQDLFTVISRLAAAEAGDPIWGNARAQNEAVTGDRRYAAEGIVPDIVLKVIAQTVFDLLTDYCWWIRPPEKTPYPLWKKMLENREDRRKFVDAKIRDTVRDGLWAGYSRNFDFLLRKQRGKNYKKMWSYFFYVLIEMEREGVIRPYKFYTIRRLAREVIRWYRYWHGVELSPYRKKVIGWVMQLVRSYGKSSDVSYIVDPDEKDVEKKKREVEFDEPLLTAYTPDRKHVIILDKKEREAFEVLSCGKKLPDLEPNSVVVFREEFFRKFLCPDWALQKKYLPQPHSGFQEELLYRLMQKHPQIEHGRRHKLIQSFAKYLATRYNEKLVKDIVTPMAIYLDPTCPFIDGPMGYKERLTSRPLLKATGMTLAPRAYSRESVLKEKLLGWCSQQYHRSYSHFSRWFLQHAAQLQDIVSTIAIQEHPELNLPEQDLDPLTTTRDILWKHNQSRLEMEHYYWELKREYQKTATAPTRSEKYSDRVKKETELKRELEGVQLALKDLRKELLQRTETVIRSLPKHKQSKQLLEPILEVDNPLFRTHQRGYPKRDYSQWKRDSYYFREKIRHQYFPHWPVKWGVPTYSQIFYLDHQSAVSYRRPWLRAP